MEERVGAKTSAEQRGGSRRGRMVIIAWRQTGGVPMLRTLRFNLPILSRGGRKNRRKSSLEKTVFPKPRILLYKTPLEFLSPPFQLTFVDTIPFTIVDGNLPPSRSICRSPARDFSSRFPSRSITRHRIREGRLGG